MPRRILNTASESLVLTEPVVIEELDKSTVEDYNKLNDKCDQVISKIKDRKKQKSKNK